MSDQFIWDGLDLYIAGSERRVASIELDNDGMPVWYCVNGCLEDGTAYLLDELREVIEKTLL